MKIDVEQFQESLPECEDYLLRSYINCAQAELDLRAKREFESAKTALKNCSKPQLLSLLSDLGIELPAAPSFKKRVRKNPLPYGWKPYVWQDQQYHVPPFSIWSCSNRVWVRKPVGCKVCRPMPDVNNTAPRIC